MKFGKNNHWRAVMTFLYENDFVIARNKDVLLKSRVFFKPEFSSTKPYSADYEG